MTSGGVDDDFDHPWPTSFFELTPRLVIEEGRGF